MTLPNYENFMKPILQSLSLIKKEAKIKDIVSNVISILNISNEDLYLTLKSGVNMVYSRINWSITYMVNAGLLERVDRGYYKITKLGLQALKTDEEINKKFLMKYPSFQDFLKRSKIYEDKNNGNFDITDPETQLTTIINEINTSLQEEILDTLKKIPPRSFEMVIINLMEAMQYGIGQLTPFLIVFDLY